MLSGYETVVVTLGDEASCAGLALLISTRFQDHSPGGGFPEGLRLYLTSIFGVFHSASLSTSDAGRRIYSAARPNMVVALLWLALIRAQLKVLWH